MFSTLLKVNHKRGGKIIDSRDLGSGLVTTAGVNALAQNTHNLYDFTYHDSGTGTTVPIISDTTLTIPSGLARVASTQTSANNIYTSTATITYTSPFTIVEWGLFSASSAGVMLDHRTFTAFTILTNDELEFVYSFTIFAGS